MAGTRSAKVKAAPFQPPRSPQAILAAACVVLKVDTLGGGRDAEMAERFVFQTVFWIGVEDEAAVFAEEGAAGKVAGVAVVEVEVRVEMDRGTADGSDSEGVGGAVVVALYVTVGEAVAVLAGDFLCDG